jgi:MFS family permease
MISSLVAGVLADWAGRKKILVASGLVFVISVLLIYTAQGFISLLLGRLLMGLSCGILAVVIPLYLAECLTSTSRGKGTAIFQFMLTFGIVVASLVGVTFTARHEAAVRAAAGDPAQILAADNAAWRGMFLVVIVPGILYA